MEPIINRAAVKLEEVQAENAALKLQNDALKRALYDECKGIACSSSTDCVGYRYCSGCDERAKKAHGPGWGDYTGKPSHEHRWSEIKDGLQHCHDCYAIKPNDPVPKDPRNGCVDFGHKGPIVGSQEGLDWVTRCRNCGIQIY